MQQPESPFTVQAAARDYIKSGRAIVPIPKGKKAPSLMDWPDLRLTEADIPQYFSRDENLGVILGEPSGGLVDIDLDASEAVGLGDVFLPKTEAVFGRPSKPRSHREYKCEPVLKSEKFADVDGTMLIELRSTGTQTVFPPSIHPSGEQIRWESEGEPTRVDAHLLREAVSKLAAAALLVRHWPKGSRHEAVLALAGALLGAGWSVDQATEFVAAVITTAGDEEVEDRVRAVQDTAEKAAAGEPITGLNHLADLLDRKVVRKLREWLRLTPRVFAGGSGRYQATNGHLIWNKTMKDGVVPIPLTNFIASIVEEIVEDDGVDTRRVFKIQAELNGFSHEIFVPADKFASLTWVTEHLGAQAIVYPGFGLKDHARVAIQELSGSIPKGRIFTHTGWRQVEGQWVYLHSGGAISKDGPVSEIMIKLPNPLSLFTLPEPPEGEALQDAIRECLRLLDIAPEVVTVPLVTAVFRSVLGDTDFSIHLAGPTGIGKTELAAVAQQHFGSGLDARHLPGNWSSTGNALEGLGFVAKDALLVIDDYAPQASPADAFRLQREGDRIFRAQGNRSGRLRMWADTTLRAPKHPRGLILSTGEDVPLGQSLRARVLIVEISPGTVDWQALSRAQAVAAGGTYAQALSAFVQHLAEDLESARRQMHKEVAERRELLGRTGLHLRTIEIAAQLAAAWRLFLDFAVAQHAIVPADAETFWQRAWNALSQIAALQSGHQASTDPAQRFVTLLNAAIATGKAHVSTPHGEAPENPGAWGWRRPSSGGSARFSDFVGDWEPQGDRIGWLDGNELYLEPDASYGIVQKMSRESGESLAVRSHTLRKRIKEAGLLKSTEPKRQTLTVRRMIQGMRREVLHLNVRALLASAEVSEPTGPDEENPSTGESTEERRA